jgi:hypothetical protein
MILIMKILLVQENKLLNLKPTQILNRKNKR